LILKRKTTQEPLSPQVGSETGSTTSPIITLRENRLPLFSLVLVVVAFCLTAYMAYLNFETSRLAGAQLVRAQQLQVRAQTKFMDQYSEFLFQRMQAQRFEQSFEVRQKYYASFMAALSDAWNGVGRKQKQDLDTALNELAKAYYGLEPFLNEGDRLYVQKRIKIFVNLSRQLMGYERDRGGIVMEDKTTMDRMIGEFQDFLYPLLFEPRKAEGENRESGKAHR